MRAKCGELVILEGGRHHVHLRQARADRQEQTLPAVAILESKKIRFNNLSDVDDVLEGSLLDNSHLAQHIFVSCWTKDEDENIALWKMYTHGKGVRIGLPDYPWEKHDFDFDRWRANGFRLEYDPSVSYHTPFTFDDIFSDKHFICSPYFMPMPNNKVFAKQVEYLEEVQLTEKYVDIYGDSMDKSTGKFTMSFKPNEFGKFKHKRWAFQNEYRFVLLIFPLVRKPNFLDHNVDQFISDTFREQLMEGKESPIKDFFLPLSDEAISTMEITLGPLCSKADQIISQSLLEKYGVGSVMRKSVSAIRK